MSLPSQTHTLTRRRGLNQNLDRLLESTFADRPKAIASGKVDFAGALGELWSRIDGGGRLNAFLAGSGDLRDAASTAAVAVSTCLQRSEHLPLAGTLLAVKDNIALRGASLTCASKILQGYESLYTATALQRLIDAGAVVVGKTNLDEFAMGSSTEWSAYGPTLNPHDSSRVAGGSSGGSAAAVAAGLATAALGSDTGGSVRQPAAYCGVVGLKPTYGRVSRYGLVAFGSSLDQIGVFGRKVEDAAKVFEVIAGLDPSDNTTSPNPVPMIGSLTGRSIEGLRVGLPVEYLSDDVQPEIKAAIIAASTVLRLMGAEVTECSLPHTKYAVPTYYILAPAEASSNLARYDGVRYGPRVAGEDGEDIIRLSRQAGFGAEVKRRIMIGTYVLSAGYYDAFYLNAQRVRRLILNDFVAAFQSFDLLLTPTTATTAFKIGAKLADPVQMYLEDIFTVPANLAGIPAISLPYGRDEQGLPIGIQLMAPHFGEEALFTVATQLEGAL